MSAAPVSVVIPYYEGRAFIDRAINSIFQQTTPPSEIVIVDDGSKNPLTQQSLDDTSMSKGSDIAVRIITHDRNRGIAAARNSGVVAAAHPWIAFLDQDDEWNREMLQVQWTSIVALGTSAHRSVFYGRAVRLDESGRELEWPRRTTERVLDTSAQHALEALVTRGNLLPIITVVVAKDALLDAGGFDETLRGGSDDYDMLLRLASRGFEFHSAPFAGAIARRHETGFNHSRAHRFLEDDVKLLEKLSREIPSIAPQLRRGLAAAHYRAGRARLDSRPLQARMHLQDALRLWPLSPRAIAAAVAAYSPPAVRSIITDIWARIRRGLYNTSRR